MEQNTGKRKRPCEEETCGKKVCEEQTPRDKANVIIRKGTSDDLINFLQHETYNLSTEDISFMLELCIYKRKEECLNIMLDHGFKMDTDHFDFCDPIPLQMADIVYSRVDLADTALVAYGFRKAVAFDIVNGVRILASRGVKLDVYKTALHDARSSECAECLLELGADIEATTREFSKFPMTPLLKVAFNKKVTYKDEPILTRREQYDIISVFMRHGANPVKACKIVDVIVTRTTKTLLDFPGVRRILECVAMMDDANQRLPIEQAIFDAVGSTQIKEFYKSKRRLLTSMGQMERQLAGYRDSKLFDYSEIELDLTEEISASFVASDSDDSSSDSDDDSSDSGSNEGA